MDSLFSEITRRLGFDCKSLKTNDKTTDCVDFALKQVDLKEYKKVDKRGMHFLIDGYEIENIGYLSILTMKAFLGMMNMKSIILTPEYKDAPIFSYDSILVGKKSTLIIELINTMVNEPKNDFLSPLSEIKKKTECFSSTSTHERWYDSLLYPESIHIKGKKVEKTFTDISLEYIKAYISLLKNCPNIDKKDKRRKTFIYVNGLLENGGPAVDQFKKMIGEEKTKELFTKYIFHIEDF